MNFAKLASALGSVHGKVIDRLVFAERPDNQFQLFLVFADGTYYEFYGTGDLAGARAIDRATLTEIRDRLARDGATVLEV